MKHISQTPPCEPGSDVPPDWSGSWNPNQITPTLPCKSQASKTSGSLCRDRTSYLTQFLNLMTPHMDSSSNSWVFRLYRKATRCLSVQQTLSLKVPLRNKRPVNNLRACAPRELNFQLPKERGGDIFRARDEQTGLEKEKNRSPWESTVLFR